MSEERQVHLATFARTLEVLFFICRRARVAHYLQGLRSPCFNSPTHTFSLSQSTATCVNMHQQKLLLNRVVAHVQGIGLFFVCC